MSQDGFWESEEAMSEEEANALMAAQPEEEAEEESHEEPAEELVAEQEDEDFQADLEVLKNARLRLEQGKLYEMLLKHNLFEGVDADEKAISNVQRELRAFIKERLEVLVGLRPDPRLKPVAQNTGLEVFSEIEIQVLKEFLGKAIGKQAPEQARPAPAKPAPTNQGLKPIKSGSTNVKVNPVKQKPTSPKAPKQAQNEPGLTKPPSEMTVQELREYNKKIAARQRSRKAAPPQAKKAMPDAQQVATLYANRVQTDPGQTLVGAIMSKMGKPLGIMENVGDGGVDETSNDSRI